MTQRDLLRQRLYNQHVAGQPLKKPEDVVRFLGAVQAQDYPGAKWAISQRTAGVTDAALDQAFAKGAILRTHVMRPTWHFVMPADIRWMLALTAPRVYAATGSYFRKLNLTDSLLAKSNALLASALKGGNHLTRPELASALRDAGLAGPRDSSVRMAFIMLRAELDAVICSGPRRGKQFTYALFDERVPRIRALSREDARDELARRYFTSHGPATLKDYIWWSGMTAADARAGLDAIQPGLTRQEIDGKIYWRPKDLPAIERGTVTAHLLTTYDECLVAYRDRGLRFDAKQSAQLMRENGQTLVIDGRVVGTWRRTLKPSAVVLDVFPFVRLAGRGVRAVALAAERFSRFAAVPMTLRLTSQG